MILNAERHRLIDTPVTLNDEPACVSGARCDFALIRQLPPNHVSGEWSWKTVKRVIDHREGRFYT